MKDTEENYKFFLLDELRFNHESYEYEEAERQYGDDFEGSFYRDFLEFIKEN